MRHAVPLLWLAVAALGQTPPPDPYAAARAAVEAAVEKQRASVRIQMENARQAPLLPPAGDEDCDPLTPAEVNGYIQGAAQREGVAPELVRSVIRKESSFRPCAVSSKGAQGLMQLMPATAARLNVEDPFDARQNIDAGTRLLKELITRYSGDLARALGAYNAGPGAVDRFGGVPPFPETVNYVSDILNRK